MMIEFECDESKNKVNRRKHGIWFEEAQTVFGDRLGRFTTFMILSPLSELYLREKRQRQKGHFMKKEYDLEKMKEIKNPYPGKKKAIGINLSSTVIDYFKKLSDESGVSYQKLIDLYLLDCVKNKKKLSMKWIA